MAQRNLTPFDPIQRDEFSSHDKIVDTLPKSPQDFIHPRKLQFVGDLEPEVVGTLPVFKDIDI